MTSRSLFVAPPWAAATPGTEAPAIRLPLLVGYLGALGVAESVMIVSVPASACCFALLALAACLAAVFFPLDRRLIGLLAVLAAIAVVRLIVVASPTAGLSVLFRFVALALPALVAVIAAAAACPREWRRLRVGPGSWQAQAVLLLVAVALGFVLYWVAPPAATLGGNLPVAMVGGLLALAVIPDELLFRGLLLPALASVAHRAAIPLAAATYAATFIAYLSPRAVVGAFCIGLALGWFRQRTDCLLGVVAARVVLVLTAYLVLPTVGL
jgi:membrane protease YdiL (CAAX protease family)